MGTFINITEPFLEEFTGLWWVPLAKGDVFSPALWCKFGFHICSRPALEVFYGLRYCVAYQTCGMVTKFRNPEYSLRVVRLCRMLKWQSLEKAREGKHSISKTQPFFNVDTRHLMPWWMEKYRLENIACPSYTIKGITVDFRQLTEWIQLTF